MSTSSAQEIPSARVVKPVQDGPLVDGKFAKKIAIACGLVPFVLLAFDAWRGELGVNAVNYAIRTTGLLGISFITLSLAITPIRRFTKWNGLLAIRRNLGVYGFVYILAHFVIFFWYDRAHDVGSTLHEIVTREYLWYGTGALVIMIPLTITSTDGMVTRLGPKRWKLLHRLTYVVIACGIIHYYQLQKSDKSKPVFFAYVAVGLGLARLVGHYFDLRGQVKAAQQKAADAKSKAGTVKKKKFWSGELKIARIFQETPDVKTFRFVSPDGGPLPFDYVAGQYLNLALTIDGKRVNRSYTIASSPTRAGYCEISVKRATDGYGSKHLHDTWREGQLVKVSAPAGKFVFAGHESERIVLIAGGVGITPMMSVVRSLTDRCWTGEMYLVFAVRKYEDIIFHAEIEHLKKRFPNLHVCITLSGDADATWTGKRGRITKELLTDFIPGFKKGPVMMCGPEPMMVATRKLLADDMGIPNDEIHEEAFVSPPQPAEGASDAPVEVEAIPDGEFTCNFQKSGKSAELMGLTVLEAAEEAGVSIPYECRSGICGQCKTKLISGRVVMEAQDALTPADKKKGLILACQAKAVQNVVVDA